MITKSTYALIIAVTRYLPILKIVEGFFYRAKIIFIAIT
jgi:hypothetical protein